jgi:hypothetical protein
MIDSTNQLNWHPICKTNPGFATTAPIRAGRARAPPAISAVFRAPPPAPGPNVFPPAAITFLTTSASTLTQDEIGYLSRWYNDTFGILTGDDVAQQMNKLKFFLCGN